MTAPATAPGEPPSKGGLIRRIVVCAAVAVLLFGVLWYTVFSAVTAAIVAAGGTGLLVVGSNASDAVESLFDLLANFILGILAAIGAFFAALFSFFN